MSSTFCQLLKKEKHIRLHINKNKIIRDQCCSDISMFQNHKSVGYNQRDFISPPQYKRRPPNKAKDFLGGFAIPEGLRRRVCYPRRIPILRRAFLEGFLQQKDFLPQEGFLGRFYTPVGFPTSGGPPGRVCYTQKGFLPLTIALLLASDRGSAGYFQELPVER